MYNRVRYILIRAGINKKIEKIEEVKGGFSNYCFKVFFEEGEIYKIRLGNNNDIIDRTNELNILKNANIEYIYYDLNTGDSIWKWFNGRDLCLFDFDSNTISKICREIERIHSAKVNYPVINHDDLEYINNSKFLLSDKDVNIYYELLDKYKGDKRVLCHNDISLSNLIYDEKLGEINLIDYEWGRINNPYWDYGNFVKESDLSEELINLLAVEAKLDLEKLYEFAVLASIYSIQLSYVFKNQTDGLSEYRRKVICRLNKYKEWLGSK